MQIDLMNIISLLIGIAGLGLSIYFGIEARRLSEQVRRFTWRDIEIGIKYLHSRVFEVFRPDLILCSSTGSVGIIANLFLTYTDKFIPLYVGVSRKIDSKFTSEPVYKAFYETSRWITYVPEEVFEYKDKKILIIEDVALSGETLSKMVDLLVQKGIKRKNILTVTLFVTEMAITAKRAPDIYWIKLTNSLFYFPWGNSVGKGY